MVRISKAYIAEDLISGDTLEKLDVPIDDGSLLITWTAYDKEEDIRKYDQSELGGVLAYLQVADCPRAVEIIRGEIYRRSQNVYPTGFMDKVQHYKRFPEIWRLKIYD